MTLTNDQILALDELQELCGANSKSKGFHADRPTRDLFIKGERGERAYANCLNDWHSNKYMLIVSEAAEAHDEIRNGHAPDETYYPTKLGTGGWQDGQQMIAWCDTCGWGISINQVKPALKSGARTPEGIALDHQQSLDRESHTVQWAKAHKPEGVPSEVADIVIRAFDYAYLAGFSLADIIKEKMDYNATRAFMHGKKF